MRLAINIVGLTAGWWACVLGAARDLFWLGPLVVAGHLALHLGYAPNRGRELRFLALATIIGWGLDSALSYADHVSFGAAGVLAWMSPMWMVSLWPNFATSLTVSLSLLGRRPGLAAVLGAVGGPFAYWGGAQLGAIQIAPNGLLWIALEWTIATPLLAALAPRKEATTADTLMQEAVT